MPSQKRQPYLNPTSIGSLFLKVTERLQMYRKIDKKEWYLTREVVFALERTTNIHHTKLLFRDSGIVFSVRRCNSCSHDTTKDPFWPLVWPSPERYNRSGGKNHSLFFIIDDAPNQGRDILLICERKGGKKRSQEDDQGPRPQYLH